MAMTTRREGYIARRQIAFRPSHPDSGPSPNGLGYSVDSSTLQKISERFEPDSKPVLLQNRSGLICLIDGEDACADC